MRYERLIFTIAAQLTYPNPLSSWNLALCNVRAFEEDDRLQAV